MSTVGKRLKRYLSPMEDVKPGISASNLFCSFSSKSSGAQIGLYITPTISHFVEQGFIQEGNARAKQAKKLCAFPRAFEARAKIPARHTANFISFDYSDVF